MCFFMAMALFANDGVTTLTKRERERHIFHPH